jgi:hypothetical protein
MVSGQAKLMPTGELVVLSDTPNGTKKQIVQQRITIAIFLSKQELMHPQVYGSGLLAMMVLYQL